MRSDTADDKIVCGRRPQDRKLPHMGTFNQAQRWIESIKDPWGNQPYTLEFDPCGIYIVRDRGRILGKGLTYEVAIADAESNHDCQTGELTLTGMESA